MAEIDKFKVEIQRTFALVEPIAKPAAGMFYERLWEVYPEVKDLFSDTDMDKQSEKLMKTLGIAVGMLDDMKTLVPILQDLGRKHVDYGVEAKMYPMVGESLLWTLEKGLGDEWTPEAKAAWQWVYGVIEGVCIEAAVEIDPEYARKATPSGEPSLQEENATEGEDAKVDRYKNAIQSSFALVEPISKAAAGMFYERLWEVNPEVKELFSDTDMDKQAEKLMKTLGVATSMLNDMDSLVPVLKDLGRKHVDYGVEARMYPMVGDALLWTLEKGLGDEWTAEHKEAWTWVYGVIQSVCIDAAREIDPEY